MAQQEENQTQELNKDISPEVEQEFSQVGTNPKQNIIILVGIAVVFCYLIYKLFIASDDTEKPIDNIPKPNKIIKPVQVPADNDIPAIPTLPSPPKLEDPTLPPPPPPLESLPPIEPPLPTITQEPPLPNEPSYSSTKAQPSLPPIKIQSGEEQQKKDAKRKSAVMLLAGTPAPKTPEQIQQEADFSQRGDMTLVLSRGKMLDAIIETAINTDFGGEIRAIISRDVYSEWGKNILIPKGSRVFGNYSTSIEGAYGRVSVEWTRVDLANGYILNLSGTGTDNLGKKGAQGVVDNKFRERITNAVLRSAFNVLLARSLDAIVSPQTSSQAVANQNVQATNIQNTANAAFTQSEVTDAQKRVNICSNVLAVITDKTSTAFTQINTACNSPTGTTDADRLTSLMSTITSAANSLLSNSTTGTQKTKAQQASEQAFTDISDTVKEFIEEQEFKPTITIDQGTVIKIYVNKDYKFPKNAISK